MAEPALDPAAALVSRADPVAFRAALFAPEPRRGRLMTLAAFDIELSRAAERAPGREEGPLLAQMRLQFWRDRVEQAMAGTAEDPDTRNHEVAAPLQALLAGPLRTAAEAALAMIEGRLMEVEGIADDAAWRRWAERRFVARQRLALAAIGPDGDAGAIARAGEDGGIVAAQGFTLRNAIRAARDGLALLPGIEGPALAALQRGAHDDTVAAATYRVLAAGDGALDRLPGHARGLGRRALPTMLPLIRDRRSLAAARRGGLVAAGETAEPGVLAMLRAMALVRV